MSKKSSYSLRDRAQQIFAAKWSQDKTVKLDQISDEIWQYYAEIIDQDFDAIQAERLLIKAGLDQGHAWFLAQIKNDITGESDRPLE